MRDVRPFNIAEWGNKDVLERLANEAAKKAPAEERAKFMLIHLRNALAHGGIAYLDKHGHHTDQNAVMLCFVSARLDRNTQDLTVSTIPERQMCRRRG